MQVQLPPKFQQHPELATGIITLENALVLIQEGWLTYEGACYLLPPSAWSLLPKPPQVEAEPKSQGWLQRLLSKVIG